MKPMVSAVIPTTGRDTLQRAVDSVLSQSEDLDIVVVVDRESEFDSVVSKFSDSPVNVIKTAGGVGGSAARNLGAAATSSKYIAFLDDDDWWEPQKIRLQLEAAEECSEENVLVASKMYFHRNSSVVEIPATSYDGKTDPASYLVTRDRIRFGSQAMQTSGIMVSRTLHGATLWDERLPKHQDWDYIARAIRHARSQFVYVDLPLVHVQQDSMNSVSKIADPRASLLWLDLHSEYLDSRARADFVMTHIVRSSLSGRSADGVRIAIRQVAKSGVPHFAALMVGLSGAVGR